MILPIVSAGTITRSFDTSEGKIIVNLAVKVDPADTIYVLSEVYPSQWIVSKSSFLSTNDPGKLKIVQQQGPGFGSYIYSYEISPASGSTSGTFSGTYSFDGQSFQNILGETLFTISSNNPEICYNNADDNGNSLIDCADTVSCEGQFCGNTGCVCISGYKKETACTDISDNDGDSLIDCKDQDCNGVKLSNPDYTTGISPKCEYGKETSCTDTFDNDGDSFIDAQDSDCISVNVGVTFTCPSSFTNAQICSGDGEGLSVDTTSTLVNSCTDTVKCEYVCNTGYVLFDPPLAIPSTGGLPIDPPPSCIPQTSFTVTCSPTQQTMAGGSCVDKSTLMTELISSSLNSYLTASKTPQSRLKAVSKIALDLDKFTKNQALEKCDSDCNFPTNNNNNNNIEADVKGFLNQYLSSDSTHIDKPVLFSNLVSRINVFLS